MRSRCTHKRWKTCIGLGAAVLLSACADNQYGPPEGQPRNFGEQHYLDNQRYQELTLDRLQT